MIFRTHILFAFFVYLLFIKIFSANFSFLPLIFILIGAVLPDIDHPKSFINKYYLLGIGKIISFFSEHRKFWHSIFGMMLIFIIFLTMTYCFKLQYIFAFALIIGYFLHLLADSFTPTGIKWFWKFSNFKTKGFIKTNSFFEKMLFWLFVFGSIYLFFGMKNIKNAVGFVSNMAKS